MVKRPARKPVAPVTVVTKKRDRKKPKKMRKTWASIISGGAITDNGDGTVDVAAGTGLIKMGWGFSDRDKTRKGKRPRRPRKFQTPLGKFNICPHCAMCNPEQFHECLKCAQRFSFDIIWRLRRW